MNLFEISTEQAPPSRMENEHELVFYGTIDSLDQLKEAIKAERHEQFEKKLDNCKIRMRSIEDSSGKRFEITIKRKNPTEDGNIETTSEIDEQFFNEFKSTCPDGMFKDRYVFKTENENMFWEVDVFRTKEGNYHRWCKVDLEIKEGELNIKSFPISLSNVIVQHKASEEEKEAIGVLYNKYFLTKLGE